MTLSARRFPETITRRRFTGGHRHVETGEWVPGTVTETVFRASVQPIALEDTDTEGATNILERHRVFVNEPAALAGAFEDEVADRVLYLGTDFVVVESVSWPRGHTRATILRQP